MTEEQIEWIETNDEKELITHIFQMDDRPEVLVKVPEWKTEILVKALTGTARAEFYAHQEVLVEKYKDDQTEYYRQIWFELMKGGCVHPKTKRPIFHFGHRTELLDKKNGAVLQMLGQTVQTLSKLDNSIKEQVKKNLEPIQNTTAIMSLQNASNTSE